MTLCADGEPRPKQVSVSLTNEEDVNEFMFIIPLNVLYPVNVFRSFNVFYGETQPVLR